MPKCILHQFHFIQKRNFVPQALYQEFNWYLFRARSQNFNAPKTLKLRITSTEEHKVCVTHSRILPPSTTIRSIEIRIVEKPLQSLTSQLSQQWVSHLAELLPRKSNTRFKSSYRTNKWFSVFVCVLQIFQIQFDAECTSIHYFFK